MKKHLHLNVPQIELNAEIQHAFCMASVECPVTGCKECIFSKENLELFKHRYKTIEK